MFLYGRATQNGQQKRRQQQKKRKYYRIFADRIGYLCVSVQLIEILRQRASEKNNNIV